MLSQNQTTKNPTAAATTIIMKLFTFLLIALASFAKATPQTLRKTFEVAKEEPRKLGPLNEGEEVTINREYNEEGQPPAGRQVHISVEYPAEEPE